MARVGAGERRRSSAALDQLEQDPDLRALTHVLHRDDFRCFGFERTSAAFQDPELKTLIEQSQAVGPSPCAAAHQPHPTDAMVLRPQQPSPEPVLRPSRSPGAGDDPGVNAALPR